MVNFNWEYLVGAAISVVGIIDWMKKFPGWKLSLLWWLLVPVTALGVAYLADGGVWQVLSNGALTWAICDLAYPVLVKIPEAILGWFKAKILGTVAGTTPPAGGL